MRTAWTRRVRGKFAVELVDGLGRMQIFGDGVNDVAAPEHVVEKNQTARTHKGKQGLVVEVVAFLVGVDEDEIDQASWDENGGRDGARRRAASRSCPGRRP